ncbi:MAG TPA: metallophosphoesterase [Oscillospiraceae bacterium]|nr:metallophosphoesterase [Oscillospiraceae bacterium]
MKLLVCSDSHGGAEGMRRALLSEKPDMLLFLGDGLGDLRELCREYPALPAEAVCGNCDGGAGFPAERLLTLAGYRILMLHGHTRGVKLGYDRVLSAALDMGADAVLFGHTHRPYHAIARGVHLLNPGSVSGRWGPARYAVLELAQKGVSARLEQI